MPRSRWIIIAAAALTVAGVWTVLKADLFVRAPGAAENVAPVATEGREQPAASTASGRVVEVGPGKRFATPSEAAGEARDGDVIEIAAGTYRGDVAIWRRDNLTLRGVGGMVHLMAEGRSAEDKAIWVIKGDNTRVLNIIFSGTEVSDRNGAGIRIEGAGLIVENCEFRDNELGIMSGVNRASDVVIRKSRFIGNRVNAKRPIGHNIYIGNIRSLTIEDSEIEGAVRGHNVKSRAAMNTLIGNRIRDGKDGASSYLVDLPAGGIGIIRNNVFEQGERTENSTLLSYGAERLLHHDNRLTVADNRFVNHHTTGTFIRNHTTAPAEIAGNSFEGRGTVLRGSGVVTGPP